MSDREKFTNPPVVEFILGVQFAPLTKLASGHFGLLWKKLGSEWVIPGDGPLIQEQFEIFDRPRVSMPTSLGWRLDAAPAIGRFTLGNQNRDKLLQFQNSRLHLNWRKSANQKPSYRTLVEHFDKTYRLVDAFVNENQIGPLMPNQWEVTYVDAFPHPDDWQTAADWSKILPGLFGQLFGARELGLKLEHRAAEWSFEIEPKRARLHISAQAGRWGDDLRDALLVTWTARGPASSFVEVLAGLELGHDKIVDAFLSATNTEMYAKWR
jgi:uncharacterized protein (TIGR04255 family)